MKPRQTLVNVDIDVLELQGLDHRSAQAIAGSLREALADSFARDADHVRPVDGTRSLRPGRASAQDASGTRAIGEQAAHAIREGLRR